MLLLTPEGREYFSPNCFNKKSQGRLPLDWFGSDALPWTNLFAWVHAVLSLEPENEISPAQWCKLRVGKKRVSQGEKELVTTRQYTKQSKAMGVLASFFCLRPRRCLLITQRMNYESLRVGHNALHEPILFTSPTPPPHCVTCPSGSHDTAHTPPCSFQSWVICSPSPETPTSFPRQSLPTLQVSAQVMPRLERALWTTLSQLNILTLKSLA